MMNAAMQEAGLVALNKVLVHIRTLAFERAPYELLAKALDAAELLPTLIARHGAHDLSEQFKSQLEGLVTLDERFGVALEYFASSENRSL